VLAHAEPRAGPAGTTDYPPDRCGHPQAPRAHDQRGWIHNARRAHDGTDPEGVIAALFGDPGVARNHSRDIDWGCRVFTVTRACPDRPEGPRPSTAPSPPGSGG
jgi:hypothetical protein